MIISCFRTTGFRNGTLENLTPPNSIVRLMTSVVTPTQWRTIPATDTTKRVIKELGLSEDEVSNSFQSRLPNDPWLKPYTDFELERFPKEGIRRLAVITPAFVSDCLETLEEIAMEGKDQFLEAGGETYKHIPCLNDDKRWVNVMAQWIKDWETEEILPV